MIAYTETRGSPTDVLAQPPPLAHIETHRQETQPSPPLYHHQEQGHRQLSIYLVKVPHSVYRTDTLFSTLCMMLNESPVVQLGTSSVQKTLDLVQVALAVFQARYKLV